MTVAAALGLGPTEVSALVGAGGKTTLMRTLGNELSRAGFGVVLTTTTHLGVDQFGDGPGVLTDPTPRAVVAALTEVSPVVVVGGREGDRVGGPRSRLLGTLAAEPAVDHLVVEADGARGRWIKAPAPHEPAIPPEATVVVAVANLRAVGSPVGAAAHRPELVAALAGRGHGDLLTPADLAVVLTDGNGGRRGVPVGARFAVCVVGGPADDTEAAEGVAASVPRGTVVAYVHRSAAGTVTARRVGSG